MGLRHPKDSTKNSYMITQACWILLVHTKNNKIQLSS